MPHVIAGSPQKDGTIGSVAAADPPRTTEPGPASRVLANVWYTEVPLPSRTASPVTLVPSGIVTALPSRRRPPGSFTPTLPRMSPSLLRRRSRAARNGVAAHWQTGSVEVVVVVDVVVLVEVVGAEVEVVDVVVVDVVVVGGAQPWTRKSSPST